MKLDTADLDAGEIHLQFAADPVDIPALAALTASGEVGFEAPFQAELRAFAQDKMILLQGQLAVRVALTCARCLKLHARTLDVAIDLGYLQGNASADP